MRAVEIITEDARKRGQVAVRFEEDKVDSRHLGPAALVATSPSTKHLSRAPRVSEQPRLAAVAEVDDEFPIRTPNRRRKNTGPPPASVRPPIPAPNQASPFVTNRPTTIDLSDEGSLSSFAGSTAMPLPSQEALDLSRPSLSSFDETASQTQSDSTVRIKATKPAKKQSLGMSRFVGAMRKQNRSGSLPLPASGAVQSSASSSSESAASVDNEGKMSMRKNMSFDSLRITSRDFWRSKSGAAGGKQSQQTHQRKALPAAPPTRQAMPSMTEAFAPAFSDGYSFFHPIHTYDTHRDETLHKSFAALPRDAKSSFAAVVESVLEQKIPEAERRMPLSARAKLKSWAQTAKAKAQAQEDERRENCRAERPTSAVDDGAMSPEPSRNDLAGSHVSDVLWLGRDGKLSVGHPCDSDARISPKSKKYCEKWKITGDLTGYMTDEEMAYSQEALRQLLYPPPPTSAQRRQAEQLLSPQHLRRNGSLRRKLSQKEYHVGGPHAHHVERRPSRRQHPHGTRHGHDRAVLIDAETKRRGGILDASAESRLNMALDLARARLDAELAAQQERRMTRRRTRQQQHLRHKSQRQSSVLYGSATLKRASFAHGSRPQTRDRSYSASNYGEGASDAGSWASEDDEITRYGQDETSPYLEHNSMDGQLYAEEPSSAQTYHAELLDVDADDSESETASPTLDNDRAWLDEAYEEAIRKEAAFSNFCAQHPSHLGGAW